jgi:hypothetical protein
MVPRSYHINITFSRASIDKIAVNNSGNIDYHNCSINLNYDFEYYKTIDFPANSTQMLLINKFINLERGYPFSVLDDIAIINIRCDEASDSWTLPR